MKKALGRGVAMFMAVAMTVIEIGTSSVYALESNTGEKISLAEATDWEAVEDELVVEASEFENTLDLADEENSEEELLVEEELKDEEELPVEEEILTEEEEPLEEEEILAEEEIIADAEEFTDEAYGAQSAEVGFYTTCLYKGQLQLYDGGEKFYIWSDVGDYNKASYKVVDKNGKVVAIGTPDLVRFDYEKDEEDENAKYDYNYYWFYREINNGSDAGIPKKATAVNLCSVEFLTADYVGPLDVIVSVDAKTYTAKGYFQTTDSMQSMLIKSIYFNDYYEDANYVYVTVYGENIDYNTVYPVLKYNGKVVTERGSVSGRVYKLKKLEGFPELTEYLSFDVQYMPEITMPPISIENYAKELFFYQYMCNTGYLNMVYDADAGKYIIFTEDNIPSNTVMNIQIIETEEYDPETETGGWPEYNPETNSFEGIKKVLGEAKIKAPKSGTSITLYDKNKKAYKYDGMIDNCYAVASWTYTSGGKTIKKGAVSNVEIIGGSGSSEAVYFQMGESNLYVKGDDIHCGVYINDNKGIKENTPITFSIKSPGSSVVILSKTIYPGLDVYGQINYGLEATFENVRLEAGTYDIEVSYLGKVRGKTGIVFYDEILPDCFLQDNQYAYWSDYIQGYLLLSVCGPRIHTMDEKNFGVKLYNASDKKPLNCTVTEAVKYGNEVHLIVKVNDDARDREYGLYAFVEYGVLEDDAKMGMDVYNPAESYYKANGWDENYGQYHYCGYVTPSIAMNENGRTCYIDNPLAETCFCYIYSQTKNAETKIEVGGNRCYAFTRNDLQPILNVDPQLSDLYKIIITDKKGNVIDEKQNNRLAIGSETGENEDSKFDLIIPQLYVGEQVNIGIDADFEVIDYMEYAWESSNTNVVKVEKGVATAIGVGTAEISAKSPKGATGSCTVTVDSYKMEGVSLNRSYVELQAGYAGTNLIASALPEVGIVLDDVSFEWSSSDESIVSVSPLNGNNNVDKYGRSIYTISSNNVGEATITVTAKQHGIEKKAECVVRVRPSVVGFVEEETCPSSLMVGQTVKVDVSFWKDGTKLESVSLNDPILREVNTSVKSFNDCVQVVDALKTEGCVYIKGLKPGVAQVNIDMGGFYSGHHINIHPCEVTICRDSNPSNDVVVPAVYGEPLGDILNNYKPVESGKIFAGWKTNIGAFIPGEKCYIYADTPLTSELFGNNSMWKIQAETTANIGGAAANIRAVYGDDDKTYTGKAIKPNVLVYKGDILLKEGKDYTISYSRNVNAFVYDNDNKENNDPKNGRMPTITITGKGNYCSKKVYGFYIEPKSIEDSDIVIDTTGMTKAANNKVQKLVPTIKYGSLTLKKDNDFTVKYYNLSGQEVEPKDAGTYKVKIAGKGNYKGEVEFLQKLTSKDEVLVSKLNVKLSFSKAEACGVGLRPTPIVKDGKTELKEGKDYYVVYSNNVLPGKANVKIIGMGSKYFGEKTVTFTITGKSISSAKVTGVEGKTLKNGMVALQNNISVTYKGETLVEGEDYIVSYLNNAKVGNASVVINGVGRYTGTKKVNFKISPTKLVLNNSTGGTGTVNMEEDPGVPPGYYFETDYCKNGVKPQRVFTTVWGEQLVEGVDYTVSYKNNTSTVIKTDKNDNDILPLMIVKGKGKYEGTMEIPFKINKKVLNKITDISASDVAYKNAKNNWYSKVNITDTNGVKLAEGVDYRVEYHKVDINGDILTKDDKVDVGQVITAVIYPIDSGACNYMVGTMNGPGSAAVHLTTTYKVREKAGVKDISKVTFKAKDGVYFEYSEGKPVEIDPYLVNVTYKEGKDVKQLKGYGDNRDYDIIAYYNNINVGTATAILKGKGDYTGTKKVTFKIVPEYVY